MEDIGVALTGQQMDTYGELIGMGFQDEAILQAFKICNGSVDEMITVLVGGNLMDEDLPPPPPSTYTPPASRHYSNPSASHFGLLGDMIRLEMSQYSFDNLGKSSCTSIASFTAITCLSQLRQKLNPLTVENLTDCLLNGVTIHQNLTQLKEHISAEEFFALYKEAPLTGYQVSSPTQYLLSNQSFKKLIDDAAAFSINSADDYVAVIITKPPETILLLVPSGAKKASTSSGDASQYVLIDSHPRPQLGIEGGYCLICKSEDQLISNLRVIFPSSHATIPGHPVSLMEEMYNSFESTFVTLKK